jgi:hypothetical protein
MKENNRNQKPTQKKNAILSKKEIKIVNNILDFKKVHKSNLPTNNNKKNIVKPAPPNKLEPIKVRLTPINKRPTSKGKKNLVLKDTNLNSNGTNNSVYLSPTHGNEIKEVTNLKIDKKITYTENRNETKEEKSNRNCSTPYRKILNIKPKESFSPSASVIIKNFNYNNVYNINIDQNKKNNKFNKTFNNNYKNIDNNTDNVSANKYTNKELISKKLTYNKPKTTSTMNTTCVLSKRNRSKEINFRNNINMPMQPLNTNESNIENRKGNETPNRNKTSNNFNINRKTYLNDYHTAAKTINNNITHSNNFMSSNSYTNLNNQRKVMNRFYNNSNLSFNGTYNKINLINSPKVFNKSNIRAETNGNDISKIKVNQEFSFNLNDLFIFEDRINDIVSAFNKTNNIYDIEASNECNEFINFYSKSSLKGLFSTFFKENNKLIIESSINLSLFFISIIYNLSSNNFLFNDIIPTINSILSFLKINFALYIKKIQLYYDFDLVKKNYIYFQPFNNFLINQNIKDIEEEDDITYKIYQNCRLMTNEIKIIMKYYQKIDVNYYNIFIKIFNNISIQKESDIINYFISNINNNSFNLITVNKNNNSINNIKESTTQHRLKKNRTNINLGYFSPYKRNTLDKAPFKTPEKVYQKSPMHTIKTETEKINKIEIPYIKTPPQKKYTLILDLNKTLAFYSKDNVFLRNGLFSFLSMIKPYYELISFSCDLNNISNNIIKEIESQKKYFDYNFKREHSILYENTLVKDISLLGRDISKIIIIDDDENCFKLNKENGIKIGVYNGNNENDNVLFELKKILILIYKKNYEDVRIAIKEFSNDIKNKVSLD